MATPKFTNKYSTAGLNVKGIKQIKAAVEAYIKKIEALSDELDTSKNSAWEAKVSTAVKGTNSEATMKGYITNVCKKCRNEVKTLRSFVDALDKLEEAYRNNDNCTDFIYLTNVNSVALKKPVIYLYPEQTEDISLRFTKNEDLLLSTYPKYNNGWEVTAEPNGDLHDKEGKYYYTLFWDAKDDTEFNNNDGFVVKGEDSANFLREKLAYIGLNDKEINEFIIYWIKDLESNKYNFIRFRQTEEINEFMPLEFNKQPDTLIRVAVDFKALDEMVEVKEQQLISTERKGFTVVEWGGRNVTNL